METRNTSLLRDLSNPKLHKNTLKKHLKNLMEALRRLVDAHYNWVNGKALFIAIAYIENRKFRELYCDVAVAIASHPKADGEILMKLLSFKWWPAWVLVRIVESVKDEDTLMLVTNKIQTFKHLAEKEMEVMSAIEKRLDYLFIEQMQKKRRKVQQKN